MRKLMTKPVRRWMYGITIAGIGVAAWYGVIPPESVVVWVPLAVAFFNVRDGAPPADESDIE